MGNFAKNLPRVNSTGPQSGASGSGGKVNPQGAAPAFGQPVQSSQAMFDPNAGLQQSNDPRMGAINPNAEQINQTDFQNWLRNQPAGSTSGRFMPQGGGDMTRQAPMLSQAAQAAQPYSYSETMNRQLPQGGSPPAFGQPVQSSQAMFDPNAGLQQSNDPRMGAINPNAGQINQADFQNWLRNQPAGSTSGRFMPQGGGDMIRQAPQLSQAAQGGMGGKGGQPPSPQQLGQGLQQQALLQSQMPNQRQPQAAGRMPPQLPMRGRR